MAKRIVAALRNPGFFAVLALVYPFLDPRCAFPSWDEARAVGEQIGEAQQHRGVDAPGPEPGQQLEEIDLRALVLAGAGDEVARTIDGEVALAPGGHPVELGSG